MSKFTPGPWKTAAPHEYIVYEDKTQAKLFIARDVDGYTEEEQIANARLIAAAPEMYDELYEILQFMQGITFWGRVVYERYAKDIAELLARIDGEKQED